MEKRNLEEAEIVNTLIDNMPAVSENVVEDETGEVENATSQAPIETVEKKDGFDPAIHCADENGNPVLTKSGAFRKRPGRGNSKTVQSTIGGVNPQQGNIQAENPVITDKKALALASAEEMDLLYWSGMNTAFPTAINSQLQEKFSPVATKALAHGFEQMEEVPKLHWSVSVGLIYLTATMAILNQPESKSTVQKIKDKLTLWFVRRKQGQAERKS